MKISIISKTVFNASHTENYRNPSTRTARVRGGHKSVIYLFFSTIYRLRGPFENNTLAAFHSDREIFRSNS